MTVTDTPTLFGSTDAVDLSSILLVTPQQVLKIKKNPANVLMLRNDVEMVLVPVLTKQHMEYAGDDSDDDFNVPLIFHDTVMDRWDDFKGAQAVRAELVADALTSDLLTNHREGLL